MKIHKIEAHCIQRFLKDKGIGPEQVTFIPWPKGCGIAVAAGGRVYCLEAICDRIVEREGDN